MGEAVSVYISPKSGPHILGLPSSDILEIFNNKISLQDICKLEIISGLFHFWSGVVQSDVAFDDGKWKKENPLAKYLLNRASFSSESGNMKVQICLLLKNLISVLIYNKSLGAETIFLSLQIYPKCLSVVWNRMDV